MSLYSIIVKNRKCENIAKKTTFIFDITYCYEKEILPIEGQRIIFLNFALYFYKTTVESIAHFFLI
jgi:hypothetical protein